MFREVSANLAVAGILSNTVPSHLKPVLASQTFVILAEEIRNLTPSASGEPLGGSGDGEYGPREDSGRFHCGRGAACKVIGCVDVVFLSVLVGKGIANAAIAPISAPKMANSTLWVVYENAIPAMLIVRGESTAKTSFVGKSDRSRLGTTIPAMNKVNTTSISSRTSEKAFCLFMLFPFNPSLRRPFQIKRE